MPQTHLRRHAVAVVLATLGLCGVPAPSTAAALAKSQPPPPPAAAAAAAAIRGVPTLDLDPVDLAGLTRGPMPDTPDPKFDADELSGKQFPERPPQSWVEHWKASEIIEIKPGDDERGARRTRANFRAAYYDFLCMAKGKCDRDRDTCPPGEKDCSPAQDKPIDDLDEDFDNLDWGGLGLGDGLGDVALGGGGGPSRRSADGDCGPDDRVKVLATTRTPYRQQGRFGFGCSGTLIGNRHVLTAGHCLRSSRHDTWRHLATSNPRAFDFSIAQGDGGAASARPFGTCRWTRAYTVRGWFDDLNADYDYGLVVLDPESCTGLGTTWRSFGWRSSIPDGWIVNNHGYPGGAGAPPGSRGGELWRDPDAGVTQRTTSLRWYYDTKTSGGHSGSAAYLYWRSGRRVQYGVHAYGEPNFADGSPVTDGTCENGAVRITSSRFRQICGWMHANGGAPAGCVCPGC